MTAFSRVQLPDDRKLNGRASMTMLKHYALCQRSGFLYQLYRGEASTPEMARGTAGHLAVQRSIAAAIEQGEPTIPGDVVKVIANEALTEVHVPIEEHDRVREGVWRWSTETAIDPSAVIALETLFELDVDGLKVRCRIDLAQLLEGGAAVSVKDWKFSVGGVPTFEEIARKRPDGTLAAKQMQLVLYALALAYGVPVREEWCPVCDGNGMTGSVGAERPDDIAVCTNCHRGRIETPEPFPLAARAQRFDLELAFPLIEDREGKMVRRPVSLTRLELAEYHESLRALVAQLRSSEDTGDWPAKVSDEACSICPSRPSCPIPVELRDHRGEINTMEQAAEAAAKLHREKAEHRARQAELRNFAKAHGPIPFDGMVFELVYSESEEIKDREGMFAAMERAVQYGEPFDRASFVRVKGRNDSKIRDLTPDEIEEAVAGD